jgi:hypothetical protein
MMGCVGLSKAIWLERLGLDIYTFWLVWQSMKRKFGLRYFSDKRRERQYSRSERMYVQAGGGVRNEWKCDSFLWFCPARDSKQQERSAMDMSRGF